MQPAKLRRTLPRRLLALSDRLLEVLVFSSGERSLSIDEKLPVFAGNAARFVSSLLVEDDVRHVGVGWGRTVEVTIDKMGDLPAPTLPAGRYIVFVPTCGEALVEKSRAMSSTWLAAALDEQFHGKLGHHLSLHGVLDLIDLDAPDEDALVIRKHVVENNPRWVEIFGGRIPLVTMLDAILTSVASPIQPNRKFAQEFAKLVRLTTEELAQRVIADIGGVWIPREDNDPVVNRWNERWTGIRLSHYAQCAEMAAREFKPGVIVVAIGENKAQVVLDVVKRGLVNTLVIDDFLGTKLLDELGDSPPASMAIGPKSLPKSNVKDQVHTMNARRLDLLKEARHRPLTAEEQVELQRVEDEVTRHVDEVVPIDYSRIEVIEKRVQDMQSKRRRLKQKLRATKPQPR